MRSRVTPIFGLSLLVLAACSGSAVSYRLTFDTQDPQRVEELTDAALRVIERRLDRHGASLTERSVSQDADGATLDLTISDGGVAGALAEELAAPFDLQIMLGTTDVANADVTVEGLGAFDETGVTGEDIETVVASAADGGGAMVRIVFTEDGLAKMAKIFKENVNKDLGLFVRGRVVSVLTINSADRPNPLVIAGSPDAELAAIFADDVNVGIHVTVTPL